MQEAITQDEVNVDTDCEDGPDSDKLQLQKNNKVLECFAGTFKAVSGVKIDVDLKIQNHVKIAVQSFYGCELENKQGEIEKLRGQVIKLEKMVDVKEQTIKCKEDDINKIKRELKWLEDKYEKKEKEIVDINTELSRSKENYQKFKKETEEAEREFIKKEETIKLHYGELLNELDRQILRLKEEKTTLSKTVSSIEAKFTIQYKEIIELWSSWFIEFKEENPKDLKSLYEELSDMWKKEWTHAKELEIIRRVQSEQNMIIATLKEEIRIQKEEIECLKQLKQHTHSSEVLVYTELLRSYLDKSARTSTTVGYTETVTRATRVADIASTGESDDDVD